MKGGEGGGRREKGGERREEGGGRREEGGRKRRMESGALGDREWGDGWMDVYTYAIKKILTTRHDIQVVVLQQ